MKELTSLLTQVGNTPGGITLVAVVSAVRSDGLLNLDVAGSLVSGVPALSGYAIRIAGDVVLVRASGKQWTVLGTVGVPVDSPDIPPETTVSWGTGPPPGSGWHTGTVYVRDHQVYVQVPPTDTDPPAARPTLLNPYGWLGFWDGHLVDILAPQQGGAAGASAVLTCWYYGVGIEDACAIAPVGDITIRLARSSTPHGAPGNQDVHLALHSASSPDGTVPEQVADPVRALALQLGEVGVYHVPADWRALLASGAARGFSVYYPLPGTDFVIFTGDSATITVTY